MVGTHRGQDIARLLRGLGFRQPLVKLFADKISIDRRKPFYHGPQLEPCQRLFGKILRHPSMRTVKDNKPADRIISRKRLVQVKHLGIVEILSSTYQKPVRNFRTGNGNAGLQPSNTGNHSGNATLARHGNRRRHTRSARYASHINTFWIDRVMLPDVCPKQPYRG